MQHKQLQGLCVQKIVNDKVKLKGMIVEQM